MPPTSRQATLCLCFLGSALSDYLLCVCDKESSAVSSRSLGEPPLFSTLDLGQKMTTDTVFSVGESGKMKSEGR